MKALYLKVIAYFKGNMDIKKLEECIQKYGPEKISFVKMEAGTNLVGGQVSAVCKKTKYYQ